MSARRHTTDTNTHYLVMHLSCCRTMTNTTTRVTLEGLQLHIAVTGLSTYLLVSWYM
jgi:hypothetical protein